MMTEIKHEIVETLGVISENAKGCKKELNLISCMKNMSYYNLI